MTADLHIVLVEPEIPQNTGNIARTCAALNAGLHLIKPLGFSISDKYVKRAGLDYWSDVDVTEHENLDHYFSSFPGRACFFITTKGRNNYTQMRYPDTVSLVFGKETKGLPEELLLGNPENCVRIPMAEGIRSLNLSNAAAIVAYEVQRQWNFPGLEEQGSLTRFTWKESST